MKLKTLILCLLVALCVVITAGCSLKPMETENGSAGSTDTTDTTDTTESSGGNGTINTPFAEQHLVFLGSSVTYGSASNGWSMCEYLSETYGCQVTKLAVSGTMLVDAGNDSYIERLKKATPNLTDVDQLIVQLSTNDATNGMPLGTIGQTFNIEDFDTSKIIGAIEYIIAYAKQELGCAVSFYTGTYYSSFLYAEMVKAIKQIQQKWDIGLINLWDDEDMLAVLENKELYNSYMKDVVHPTKLGYSEWWGPKFYEHLSTYKG